jgi:hypothetical protein
MAPLLAGFYRGEHNALHALHIIEGGYVSLAVAAGLVAFDRFFGQSSGWIRYMMTLAAVERLIAEFQTDWARLLQEAEATPGPASKSDAFLERAADARRQLFDLVEAETALWASEFRTSLSELDLIVHRDQHGSEFPKSKIARH